VTIFYHCKLNAGEPCANAFKDDYCTLENYGGDQYVQDVSNLNECLYPKKREELKMNKYYPCKWNDGKKCANSSYAHGQTACILEFGDPLPVSFVTTCCRHDKRKTPEPEIWFTYNKNHQSTSHQPLTIEFAKKFIKENS
jgi:hypothetical protein